MALYTAKSGDNVNKVSRLADEVYGVAVYAYISPSLYNA
jgi:hypothetical protein